jgi:peptidyl-prolyl cis-trans isomerase B (cyclophilin B)
MANKKQVARAAAEAAKKAQQAKNDKRNMIIGIVAVLLVAAVALGFILSGDDAPANQPSAVVVEGHTAASEITEKVTHNVVIEVEDYGTISAVLYGEAAPITVANFVKLANEGFYDGLTFHRIISGFMIQGGDPLGNGTGGSSETIKGEFFSNGVDNPIKHKRGVLSMARSADNNSASSQFFIMHDVAPWLDGSYASFGCVTEGIEVVDAICQKTPVLDSNGTVAKVNQPKIVSIRVTEVTE